MTVRRGRHKGGFSSGAEHRPRLLGESIRERRGPAASGLRRDTIELYMLHSPTVAQLETQTWPEAVEKLKAEGTIRSFGISTHDHASGHQGHRDSGADFLQIEYDLLDPTAEDELLPLAREAQHRHHDPDAAGARPAERQVHRRPGRSRPSSSGAARPATGSSFGSSASSSFGSWSARARRWRRRRCAGCWRSRASTASSPAPAPSSSLRPTSAPSTAT